MMRGLVVVTEETLDLARTTAAELRQEGQEQRAQAIEALVEAAREEPIPTLDYFTTTKAGNLLGVTGQTIKNWVREGRLTGYRVGGRVVIPRRAVEEYVRRARGSLDLDDFSDEEAAELVAESRQGSAG